MSEPTKAELLAVVCELTSTIEQLYAEYANDVSQGRAAAMDALREHGVRIGNRCLSRTDYDKIEVALRRFPQPKIDTRDLRK